MELMATLDNGTGVHLRNKGDELVLKVSTHADVLELVKDERTTLVLNVQASDSKANNLRVNGLNDVEKALLVEYIRESEDQNKQMSTEDFWEYVAASAQNLKMRARARKFMVG
jgi:hypothetical protein